MSVPTRSVFVVDDASEVRVSMARMLGAAGYDVEVFESAEKYLDRQEAEGPGCLLLDVCMPGLSGLELQSALSHSSQRPIVFLSGHGDIATSVRAMKAGAVDFLTKPVDPPRLFAAVEQALRRDDTERLERTVRQKIEQRLEGLTRRERQVMERVISGGLNKQIAASLGTAEKTVKVHRGRMMAKMGARSVAELVRIVARAGFPMELPTRRRNFPET